MLWREAVLVNCRNGHMARYTRREAAVGSRPQRLMFANWPLADAATVELFRVRGAPAFGVDPAATR